MKKYSLLLISMLVFSMFMIGSVNAAFTCTSVSPTTLNEGTRLNVSFADDGDLNVSISVAYFVFSSSTGNTSTTALFKNITNATSGTNFGTNISAGFALGAFDVDRMEDGVDYTIAPIAYNGSLRTGGGTQTACTTQTGITFSRTTPSAPTTTQASESVLKTGDTVTYTVIGANTTGCRIDFSTGGPKSTGSSTFPMIHSGNTCTFTLTNSISDGAYNLYGFATDGTDSIFSSKLLVSVGSVTSNSQDITEGVQIEVAKKESKNDMMFLLIIVLGGGALWWYANNSGSGKKS